MWSKLFPNRFSLLKTFAIIFLSVSFIVRLSLFIWDFSEVDKDILDVLLTFITGTFFDIGTLSFFMLPFCIYLILLPSKWHGSLVDRILTYTAFFIGLLIIYFSFLGEFTFWEEFHRRYNFIAVDYLVYTYEVVKNINESYPLPLLISILLALILVTIFITKKLDVFNSIFTSKIHFKQRILATIPWLIIVLVFTVFIPNNKAEWSTNRFNNELSKAGIYSFFSAFRNNELAYTEFYNTIPVQKAFDLVKETFADNGDTFIEAQEESIYRNINTINPVTKDSTLIDSLKTIQKPNVIFICIESLSGKYLNSLGGDYDITPTLDSLANTSLYFTNLFATGTRTVRGMEAITLSIPPTPGRSIVKRINNTGLFTIGEVFKEHGYNRNFFYGGDGYFDNMNTYFGGNGFNIVDRGRGFLLDESITTTRTNIEDDEVTFENAWGVCDEDIYNKVIKEADKAYETGEPFFDFVMTTSNHKPFTYPEGKIDIPSGTGRNGAIKYTDYAINSFLKVAKTKPWYQNTIFVIMSDHCASSAGKWELDVQNYHIPAMIVNLPNTPNEKVDNLCSQIDVFPTLFAKLGWEYNSNLFGVDITKMSIEDERAFIGNYRKLGLLVGNKVMILGDQKKANFYKWQIQDNSLESIPMDTTFLEKTISFYQVADYLYTHKGLKLKE